MNLDYEYRQAAADVRQRLHAGETGDAMREAVEEVRDLAPPEHQFYWKQWAAALQPGHRIKFAVADATFTPLDADDDLIADVESAFGAEGE